MWYFFAFSLFSFKLLCLRSPFPRLQGWILSSFWFLPSLGWSRGLCELRIGWDLCWGFVCLFVFPLMGKAEWGDTPVCWWLGLYFCFVCCLDEVSCTGCYWWLGDAGSCIPVLSFVWVLTIWYPLELVLWYLGSWSECSHSKGSGLDLWSGIKIPQVVSNGIKWD